MDGIADDINGTFFFSFLFFCIVVMAFKCEVVGTSPFVD